jgi:predicted transcriptional regulator
MSSIRFRAHEIIDNISEKKIAQILDFLEYLKIKEEAEATKDIVTDKFLYAAIEKGLQEVKEGELIDLESVKEDV